MLCISSCQLGDLSNDDENERDHKELRRQINTHSASSQIVSLSVVTRIFGELSYQTAATGIGKVENTATQNRVCDLFRLPEADHLT